jgi:septal ring factor EnvC (AmiA/AmiB activator)
MTKQYIRLSRIREWELEKAVEEKLAEGWELHTPISPITRVGSAWGNGKHKNYTLDQYKGSYMTQKFFCTMRREVNVLNKSEARKRVATINKNNMEFANELFEEIESLKKELSQLKTRHKNVLKSRDEKEMLVRSFENNYKRVNRLNNHLEKENANLRVKVNELTEKLSEKQRRDVGGMYPAVVKVGKKHMFLGVFKTVEEAEKREKEAYEAL